MEFDLPKERSSIIKVIGIGGGGCNAVNHMFEQGIKDVNFVICNTDAQALEASPIPNKIQLGPDLTKGRGAGSHPEKGKEATMESMLAVKEILESHTEMVFITAGMGGGTGTGGAPVVARIAREMGVLTVGIVTVPFSFEGKRRIDQACEGVAELKKHVDALLVVSNDKLREVFGNLKLSEAFNKADDVLTTAAKGIAEIITITGYVNVDFEDVKTVLRDSGVAIMGSGMASGENRALKAVEAAMSSPLLSDNDIRGARHILLNITSGDEEVLMDEITEITEYVQDCAGNGGDIIWGNCHDESLGNELTVTVIATGFDGGAAMDEKANAKVIYDLEKAGSPTPTPAPIPQASDSAMEEPFILSTGNENGSLNGTAAANANAMASSNGQNSFGLPGDPMAEVDPMEPVLKTAAPQVSEPVIKNTAPENLEPVLKETTPGISETSEPQIELFVSQAVEQTQSAEPAQNIESTQPTEQVAAAQSVETVAPASPTSEPILAKEELEQLRAARMESPIQPTTVEADTRPIEEVAEPAISWDLTAAPADEQNVEAVDEPISQPIATNQIDQTIEQLQRQLEESLQEQARLKAAVEQMPAAQQEVSTQVPPPPIPPLAEQTEQDGESWETPEWEWEQPQQAEEEAILFNYKSEPAQPEVDLPASPKPAEVKKPLPNQIRKTAEVTPLLRADLNDETIPLAGTAGPVPKARNEADRVAGFVDDFEEREKERLNEERKKRLRNLSMKFNNVEELEKTPAYLRRNVPLEAEKHSSEEEVSRFTLNEVSKDGEESGLRKNNSFLHDNVD